MRLITDLISKINQNKEVKKYANKSDSIQIVLDKKQIIKLKIFITENNKNSINIYVYNIIKTILVI